MTAACAWRDSDIIHVFLNGEPAGSLEVPIPVKMDERRFWFQSIAQNFPTEGLQVLPWTGEPDPQTLPGPAAEGEMLWRSGRSGVPGQLLPGTSGQIVFRPEGAGDTETVPVDEIAKLRLRSDDLILPRRNARDVQIWMCGAQQPLTLAVRDGGIDRIVGTGDAWASEISIPFTRLDAMRFNPYQTLRRDDADPPQRGHSAEHH